MDLRPAARNSTPLKFSPEHPCLAMAALAAAMAALAGAMGVLTVAIGVLAVAMGAPAVSRARRRGAAGSCEYRISGRLSGRFSGFPECVASPGQDFSSKHIDRPHAYCSKSIFQ